MRVFLVRIGIDSTRSKTADNGGCNAPVDTRTGEFVYVPVLQSWPEHRARPEMRRCYRELLPSLERFASTRGRSASSLLPPRLHDAEMHLDPDFEHLTYGDSPTPRGKQIARAQPGDWLVFIAGLEPTNRSRPLYYAIIGRMVVESIQPASEVSPDLAHTNAHTRPPIVQPGDVVIRGSCSQSGRLTTCIGIGELRGHHPRYRVRTDLLEVWGGLRTNDGYIQRGSPFETRDPDRFVVWWKAQRTALVARNWD